MSRLMDGSMVSLMDEQPFIKQDINTSPDVNGNSRKCRIIYNAKGQVIDVLRWDYGYPIWTDRLFSLPSLRVGPTQYRMVLNLETGKIRQ